MKKCPHCKKKKADDSFAKCMACGEKLCSECMADVGSCKKCEEDFQESYEDETDGEE